MNSRATTDGLPALDELPTVVIVGRPNVGKSTLMNRILGRREAIVEERPGVTRDRKEVEADWRGRSFRLIDTGGWMPSGTELDDKVSRQSEKAMNEADVVLFVVDAEVGVTEDDANVAELLLRAVRRSGPAKGDSGQTRVLVVANKVDDGNREGAAWEMLSLGLGNPWPISALHGRGTGDLLDEVVDHLPEEAPIDLPSIDDPDADRVFSVSVVGRPNVGKSTLFNRLIGDDRSVVHDMPGTTRDAVDTVVDTPEGPIRFVDTAGMRRRARIDEGTEYYSFVRALRAVDASDVSLLVIDATEGITHQDQRLAERIDAAGCPIVVVLNKWETLDAESRADIDYQVGQRLHFLGTAPVLKISALTGKGVHQLMPTLTQAISEYNTRVPTRRVNQVIRAAQQAQPAPGGARVLYATQGASDPPTFTLFTNRDLPATYLRYLERRLREDLNLGATPIKLRVRRRAS